MGGDRACADWSLKTEGYREMRRRGERFWANPGLSADTQCNGRAHLKNSQRPSTCKDEQHGTGAVRRVRKALSAYEDRRSSALPASLCSSQRKDEQAKTVEFHQIRPCPCDLSAEEKDSPNADTRKHEHNLQGMGQPA